MRLTFKILLLVSPLLLIGPKTRAQDLELIVQTNHSGPVTAVAFSPDGKLLATAGNAIKLWDVASGRQLRALAGHLPMYPLPSMVSSISFSPDGKYLASGGLDDQIKLWDVSSGRALFAVSGFWMQLNSASVTFSPDSRILASPTYDGRIKLWEVPGGRELQTLAGDSRSPVSFSPDGRFLAGVNQGKQGQPTINFWDAAGGRKLRTVTLSAGGQLDLFTLSPDLKILAGTTGGPTIKLWDADGGSEPRTLSEPTGGVHAVAFSPDGKFLLSLSASGINLWDVAGGKAVRKLTVPSGGLDSATFSPDGKLIAGGGSDGTAKLWDAAGGNQLQTFGGDTRGVDSVSFSPDGKSMASLSKGTIRIWDVAGGKELQALTGHKGYTFSFSSDGRSLAMVSRRLTIDVRDAVRGKPLRTVALRTSERPDRLSFSPDLKVLAGKIGNRAIKLWDTVTGDELRTLGGQMGFVFAFSPEGKLLASSSDGEDRSISIWDVAGGRQLPPLVVTDGPHTPAFSLSFSPGGKFLARGSMDGAVRLWDVAGGRQLHTLTGHRGTVESLSFSPDGRILASGSEDGSVRLWDVASGEGLRTITAHSGWVRSVTFSPDGKFLASGSDDGAIKIWRVTDTGQLNDSRALGTLFSFTNGTWAVVDSAGRFDASSGGDVAGLHWVVGNEPIALNQLKERYYDPGLLAKLLDFDAQPLRNVQAFRSVALYPEIALRNPTVEDPILGIRLSNRGGGIGKVVVSINGKEISSDARGADANPDAAALDIDVDLSDHPYLLAGRVNLIEVRALNAEGYLSSRGVTVSYQPPGIVSIEKPTLWAIVAGVSDYSGDRIDLRYAAKDARDMGRALQLGAARLFGAGKTQLALLSATDPQTAPTKTNIKLAFERTRTANPWDIVVVYLAGHGVALGDTYYYLTQEARTTELTDPAIRAQAAISSEELVEWIKQSPALKQVMVLDTCAAGSAARNLVENRSISSDQIRAIERLKDRTGFHVLMGSAADAVSYEATQYQQGLLTYALLHGLRGAALREGEYVDVSTLFQYAADEVPKLAGHIGGIQRPQIAAPRGTSFDIGQLTAQDQQNIPLVQSKPMLLRPMLQNAEELFDNLELTARLRQRLREDSYASLRGEAPRLPAVFVDADQLAGAIRPSGNYRVIGDTIQADLVLVKDGQRLKKLRVQGSVDDLKGFTDRIAGEILRITGRIQ